MRVEEEKCFETVRLLEKKGMVLELNCSNNFWIVCKNSDAIFQYKKADGTWVFIKVEV